MTTLWTDRIYAWVRANNNTQTNRRLLGNVYTLNGSGELVEDEEKLLLNALTYGRNATPPITALGFNSALKPAMTAQIVPLLDAWGGGFYALVANVAHDNLQEGELISTDVPGLVVGQITTWQEAETAYSTDTGFLPIPPDDPLP